MGNQLVRGKSSTLSVNAFKIGKEQIVTSLSNHKNLFNEELQHQDFDTVESTTNLKTQLNQISYFGHHVNDIFFNQASAPINQLQSSMTPIQRQENKKSKKKTTLKAIPPELSIPFTDRFKLDIGSSGLNFGYGRENFSGDVGINPFDKSLSLAQSYKKFNLGGNVDLDGGFGGSIGYGLPLLPWLSDLTDPDNPISAGGNALTNVVGSFPSLLENPRAFDAQKENFSLIGKAGGVLGQIFNKKNSDSDFGAGLNFNFNPNADITKGEERFRIMAGIRKKF